MAFSEILRGFVSLSRVAMVSDGGVEDGQRGAKGRGGWKETRGARAGGRTGDCVV